MDNCLFKVLLPILEEVSHDKVSISFLKEFRTKVAIFKMSNYSRG